MEYFYRCFTKIIRLQLDTSKEKDLDFWIERFCPNVEILSEKVNFDIGIECIDGIKYDYIVEKDYIRIYGKMNNYSSFLAKFITQVFQKLLIDEEILFVPASCVANNYNCLLILGDFWQGKTSTALNIVKKYNLNLISDNYVAIKNGKVIGATKYISKREEDTVNISSSLLNVNNRFFFKNLNFSNIDNLKINSFLLPFINCSDNNIHLISKEESKWYLYQKFIRLLSGESILFNGKLPSPFFLDKEKSILILNIVNELLNNVNILYVSSSMNKIIEEGFKCLDGAKTYE